VQKKEQIGGERRLGLVVETKLGVNEHENPGEPEGAAQGQEHPEAILTAVGRGGVPEQEGIAKQGNDTGQDVAEIFNHGQAGREHGRHEKSADEKCPRAKNQDGIPG
jgi:hypothetical protein